MLSIVVPVLNEADGIEAALLALAPLRDRGAEVIVVDGGSADGTLARATPLATRVLAAPRGRASQMNAGAAAARGEALVFLHADTRLPPNADAMVTEALTCSGRAWGRFDVQFNGGRLPLIARMMNLRSRLSGIATGDQAMFVRRDAFERAGGFPPIALMEDIALSTRLKRLSPPLCLPARVTTSPRRWLENGVTRTVLLMWRLRLAYVLGIHPDTLARAYHHPPKG
jgi:rSAM/selenodomain-associated transferase 2